MRDGGVPRCRSVAAARRRLYRGYTAFLRTGPGRWTAIQIAARSTRSSCARRGGHVGAGLMLPSLNMTTTGAKSGQPRTATVLYFSDGDDVIVIASSFGRDKHPAWYHNLKAHPDATLERVGPRGALPRGRGRGRGRARTALRPRRPRLRRLRRLPRAHREDRPPDPDHAPGAGRLECARASILDGAGNFLDAVGSFFDSLASVDVLDLLIGMAAFVAYLTLRSLALLQHPARRVPA